MTRTDPLRAMLKAGTRLLISEIGTVDASAEFADKSKSQMHRYQSVTDPDFMTIDTVAVLEGQAGVTPHVTRALAAANHHILVACPALAAKDGPWVRQLGDLAREAGELMSKLGTALADGKITRAEIEKLQLRLDVAGLQSVLANINFGLELIEAGTDARGDRDNSPP